MYKASLYKKEKKEKNCMAIQRQCLPLSQPFCFSEKQHYLLTVNQHKISHSVMSCPGSHLHFFPKLQLLPAFSSFHLRWLCGTHTGPHTLHPISRQSPAGCLQGSTNVSLLKERLFPSLESGTSTACHLLRPHNGLEHYPTVAMGEASRPGNVLKESTLKSMPSSV